MAYVTDGTLGIDLAATSDTQVHALGDTVKATDNQEYVYVQASGAISQYDAVGIDENFQCASLTKTIADDGWTIGFAQVAFTDNYYGWVATRGSNLRVNTLASCAADVALYTTATPGALDDTSASQTNIDGIVIAVASGTATAASAEVLATFPRSTTF